MSGQALEEDQARPTLALALADLELDALLTMEPVFGLPQDNDAERKLEASGDRDLRSTDSADPVSWDLGPLLNDLRERDADLLAGACIVSAAKCVDLLTRDDGGRLESTVAALVYEGEYGTICIPLGRPLHERFFRSVQQGSLAERVRLLTEFVRVFRDLVGRGGLSESIRRDAVSRLGELVGFLRTAISDASKDPAESTHKGRAADSEPRSDEIGIHGVSISLPVPSATVGVSTPNPTPTAHPAPAPTSPEAVGAEVFSVPA